MFDELKIILDDINQHHPISVICLQETHLDENDPTLNLELNDYQLIFKSRYCSKAGGLIIYIHNDFNFKHVDIMICMFLIMMFTNILQDKSIHFM